MLQCIARNRTSIFHLKNLSPGVHTSFGERRFFTQSHPISTPQPPLSERNVINELKKVGIHIPQPDYSEDFIPFSAGIMECDSPKLMMMKLSEGHKPATEILEYLYSKGPEVDPSASPEFLLIRLNNLGICGKNIQKLYNACGKKPVHFIALFRANQLNLISEAFIYETINTEYLPDPNNILKNVQNKLRGNFNNPSKQTIQE